MSKPIRPGTVTPILDTEKKASGRSAGSGRITTRGTGTPVTPRAGGSIITPDGRFISARKTQEAGLHVRRRLVPSTTRPGRMKVVYTYNGKDYSTKGRAQAAAAVDLKLPGAVGFGAEVEVDARHGVEREFAPAIEQEIRESTKPDPITREVVKKALEDRPSVYRRTATVTKPPELPEAVTGDKRREPVTVADTSDVNLPGLRGRQSIATGGNAAANRVSQAAQGALAGGQLSQRSAISSDVGPQFQVQQLSVNQDLQGRATAEQTAAAGIRADLPDRIAAQRSVTARGQQRGRASTILTGGGAAGLGSQPANTLGRRRLTSGQVRPGQPAPSPAAQSQAGEAAEQQVRTQQRQGVIAEQDRQEAPPQDPRRSVSPRETERERQRQSLITGEGTGDRPAGQSGGGGGQSFEGFADSDLEGRVRDFQDDAAAAELRRRRGGAQTRGGGNVGRGRSLLSLSVEDLRQGRGAALGISRGLTREAARTRTPAQLTEFIRRRNARLNADVNAARRARG